MTEGLTDQECERVLRAVIDFNVSRIQHKMLIWAVDWDTAFEMWKAEIVAEEVLAGARAE